MALRVQLTGVKEACDALSAQLDEQVHSALWRLSNAVAQSAHDSHTFTNRTGRLEASIAANMPTGTFTRDSLSGAVVAAMPYGEYVEGHGLSSTADGSEIEYGPFGFLSPALVREEATVNGWLEHALIQAAHNAGWGT